MGFFSSSSSSSSSATPVAGERGSLPTRSSRTACWDARDAYYACLTRQHVVIPPGTDMSDGRGPVGKAAAQAQRQRAESLEEQRLADPCAKLRGPYEGNCAKSWVSGRSSAGQRREEGKRKGTSGGRTWADEPRASERKWAQRAEVKLQLCTSGRLKGQQGRRALGRSNGRG